ncbi:peflin [Arthroderma uncinatum]|uniref:peflin n=1 Tax=Arthroderma uncinatum TaxID=74035 RepID=UPI00144A71AC|nr:peflin [Arthroderma uncinatum]KAF3492161.1 peflin [Arthroderma uncinatum]
MLGALHPPPQQPAQNQRPQGIPDPHAQRRASATQSFQPPRQPGGGRYDYPPSTSAPLRADPYYNQNPNPSIANRLHSPPPQHYGFGPRPVHPAQNRPPPSSYPPRTPLPPSAGGAGAALPASNEPHDLFPLFRAANASNSGSLSASELGSALVNGDYTSFNRDTVTMMIRMFDRDGNGTVGFDEFVALWRFLAAWRGLFDRFDEDMSGRISFQEFSKALIAFGYKLSPTFVQTLFTTFESKGQRGVALVPGRNDGMSFDLFVQACITLKRMTDVFKRYDDDRDGYITLSFEEFLTEILPLRE